MAENDLSALPESTPPTVRIICEILFRETPNQIIPSLVSTGIVPTLDLITQVLSLSYDHPFSAVKFFQWASPAHQASPSAWALIIDLLARNRLFDSMWNAIRSMRDHSTLSLAAFISAFESYSAAGRFSDAVMTFDVMHKHGLPPRVPAANSLLRSLCAHSAGVSTAIEFLNTTMRSNDDVSPDGESFSIILEAIEKEGDVKKAKKVFKMTAGWDRSYVAAYDAFLVTLVKAGEVKEAVDYLGVMSKHGCLPGLRFLRSAVEVLVRKKRVEDAVLVWDVMVCCGGEDGGDSIGVMPDLGMYNAMIGLMCDCNEVDRAFRLLDEMVYNGAFADSVTYNAVFKCLIKHERVREARKFFAEMVKNECLPTHFNFAAAIAMFFDKDDPEMGVEMWNFMVEQRVEPLDVAANALLLGLCKLDRLSELKRCADDMLDRRISIYGSTMTSVKGVYYKGGKGSKDKFDGLERRWKKVMAL